MKIIKTITEMINEELEGAEEYAKQANKYKDERPALAKIFYDMSADEMKHIDALHDEVVDIITAYRKEKGEPPAEMQAVYDWEHEKQIEKANKVKMYQTQYRGM